MTQITSAIIVTITIFTIFLGYTIIHSSVEHDTTFRRVSNPTGVKTVQPTYGNPTWVDFDNDGNIDLLVINHGEPPSLFHNDGNGSFTDIRPGSGISANGDRHGAAWGDYDNDGNVDLFITIGADRGRGVGMKNDQLYRNDGNGFFTDVTAFANVSNSAGRGRSVNWVDFNNDGYLDLFVKNSRTPNVLYRNNGDGTFTDVAVSAGIADAPGEVSAWADYDNDGNMDLFITSAAQDQLWRNNGDETFTEVTSTAGLKSLNNGQGVAWGDYNNDGNIDLYIARGYHDVSDSLSWNGSMISFSDIESTSENGFDFSLVGNEVTFDLYFARCRQPSRVYLGNSTIPAQMIPIALTASEVRGKPSYIAGKDIGFFIWTEMDTWKVRWSTNKKTRYFYGRITTNGHFITVNPITPEKYPPPIVATLYRNNGDGTFTDVTEIAGVGSTKNNRAVIWGDYDNDGYLDLYIVNSGSFKGNGSNTLYRNMGDGRFEDVTGKAGIRANVNGRGDGAAWGDVDNDGFLDLYITNGSARPVLARYRDRNCLIFGPHLLYMNNGNSNRWLKITLVGTVSNRDAIGTKVTLRAGGLIQSREVNGGGAFFSQGSGPVHFGLGQSNRIDSISIRWPSGITQMLTEVDANQSIIVIEDRS